MAPSVRPGDPGRRRSPVGPGTPQRAAHRSPRRRRRLTALVGGLLAVLVVSTLMPAVAQSPEQRKRQVERQISGVREDLDHSTKALSQATQRFQRAQAALPGAQRALALARGKLVAARAADAAAQEKLVKAEEAVAAAELRVATLSEQIVDQRERMGQIAATAYRGSGLSTLSIALTSTDPSELSRNIEAVQSVLRSEGSISEGLADDRAELATQRAGLEGLRRTAQTQREAAAKSLERTKKLEAAAAQRAAEVRALVKERQAALQAAKAAKAEDTRRYRQLVKERNRIERLIQERIRRERARQQREARERAAREARERARANARSGSSGSSGGGSSSAGGYLSYPLRNGYITSPYGMRVHPVTGIYKLHDGTDFGAGCGTPIYAAAPGTVVWASYQGAYGNQVLVDHGWVQGRSMMTSYSHMTQFSAYSGERVSRGELIGYVGTTGYSTGCHLHFMVYRDGGTADPMAWL